MKKRLTKWFLTMTATGVIIIGAIVGIILTPQILYAHSTEVGNYKVYHNTALDQNFNAHINKMTDLIKKSEFYNPSLKLDICLNDGSNYPSFMKLLRGQAFAWGFYNKVVLMGDANYQANYTELNGYKWNYTELIAHEAVHCLQFNHLGLWQSNPIANIADWKWEGYPEYIARKGNNNNDLVANIDRLIAREQQENNNWIGFEDGTGTVIPYYKCWLLMQYSLDIKKLTYEQLLKEDISEQHIREEMMNWYKQQKQSK